MSNDEQVNRSAEHKTELRSLSTACFVSTGMLTVVLLPVLISNINSEAYGNPRG